MKDDLGELQHWLPLTHCLLGVGRGMIHVASKPLLGLCTLPLCTVIYSLHLVADESTLNHAQRWVYSPMKTSFDCGCMKFKALF